LGAPQ